MSDRTVHRGMLVNVNVGVVDPDFPGHAIGYALGLGAPVGSGITNGVFTWRAEAATVPATNDVTIIATDTGLPPMIDSKTFRIVVVERPRIESISVAGTNVVMTWTAVPGVQFQPDLQHTNWLDLPGSVTATNSSAEKVDVRQAVQRFYQIRVLP
jgi:hypothetical protein